METVTLPMWQMQLGGRGVKSWPQDNNDNVRQTQKDQKLACKKETWLCDMRRLLNERCLSFNTGEG